MNAFSKSISTKRTPPSVPNTSACKMCEQPDTNDMVACDKCDAWFHFDCVGVDASIASENWMCQKCVLTSQGATPKDPALHSKQNEVKGKQPSKNTRIHSSSSKSEKNKRLELQRLEEQRALDKKYLDEKYRILNGASDEEDSDDDQSEHVDRTSQWVNRQHEVIAASLNNGTQPIVHETPFNSNTQRINKEHIAARQALPRELPIFSGRPEEWPMFFSFFNESTTSCNFSHQENLYRLQRCLKGKALESVSSRLMLPSNVPGIIETLRLLFGRPEVIINVLLQKIRNEPSPKAEKLETLMTFAFSVQNLCATMEASGLVTHLTNPILLQELTDRLPPQIKLNWAMYKMSIPVVTISTFAEWLNNIAKAASEVTLSWFDHAPSTSAQTKSTREKGRVNAHSSPSEPISQPSSKSTTKNLCRVCEESSHHVQECKTFLEYDHNKRWQTVKEKRLCRMCLRNHKIKKCNDAATCGTNGCTRKHHQLLHNSKNDAPVVAAVEQTNTHRHQQITAFFRIVPVTLHNGNVNIDTYAFLDEGSSLTLVQQDLANRLGIKGESEHLCLKWTADMIRNENNSRKISLEISGTSKGAKKYRLVNARTVEKLSLPKQSISNKLQRFSHLKDIPFVSYENAVPKILIGMDNCQLGLPLKIKEGKWKEPVATKTRLGWIIHGQNAKHEQFVPTLQHFHLCHYYTETELHQLIKQFFSTESFGVEVNNREQKSPLDERASKLLTNTTKKLNGFYETGLLWKSDYIKLPASFEMAKNRLICLERRMKKEPSLQKEIEKQINDYIIKGYARIMSTSEVQIKHPRAWYLPIFTVTNHNKPGKVRMVWDAAATVNGVSLNSALMKGPEKVNSLLNILFRFRERRFGISGDIKEMYHQVKINTEDQNSQRFLWRKNSSEEIGIYVMTVMTFGATCSPCSAQYVKDLNASQHGDTFPRAVYAIKENHYVDDLLDSLDTEDEAIKLANDIKFIHTQAGFQMRNWISNSTKVMRALGETIKESTKSLDMSAEYPTEKVLGMHWCITSDKFTYSLKYHRIDARLLKGERIPTKREVLRTLMSVFDPLGLIANYIVQMKIILQKIWKVNIDWDEPIPEPLFQNWKSWILCLPNIQKIQIARCHISQVSNLNETTIELHVFTDASEEAFAAVAYFRIVNNNNVNVSLVSAKTKVAPQKPLSIPRLELQAALLGSRLAMSIKNAHTYAIHQTTFWTDSKTVLSWLQAEHRNYKQFVALRLGEILENSDAHQWRWVPTALNIADEATKTKKSQEFHSESRWFAGPDFLLEPKGNWPPESKNLQPAKEELRANYVQVHTVSTNLIDVSRFSSWLRLLRTQAYILRFLRNTKNKVMKVQPTLGVITAEEYDNAEIQLIRQLQRESYAPEIQILKSANSNVPKNSTLYKLSAYLDKDQILRLKGRIDAASYISEDTKRPIILDRKNTLTRLIIMHYHSQYHHCNNETIINEIKQKFYISKLRATVRKIVQTCQRCKIHKATPRTPEMADLPRARLSPFLRPFSFIGVDYFGPLFVAVGRRQEKRWGVLFTCLTMRAVHLEIAHTLDTNSCIMCLSNFMSRRGVPIEIYSDNGTNFRSTSREVTAELKRINKDVMQEKFATKRIKWFFNPPAAPHFGGSWERLVRSVKVTLAAIMPDRSLSDEVLRNLLAEVEFIINSRPLTYMPVDENQEALTPNHFLLGSSSGEKPKTFYENSLQTRRSDWRTAQTLADSFWKRWVKEYLPTLVKRTKWFQPSKPIEVGDLVIIVDEHTKRNTWLKGRVIDVISTRSGQVRQAKVFTKNGVYTRPAVKLAVLNVGKPAPVELTYEGEDVAGVAENSTHL